MTIKVSILKSVLHENDLFNLRNNKFLQSIEEELNNKLIISDINDYNCDLKLIFIESGGSEMLFLNQLENLKAPFYFLTSGDNNSLAATLEILTYLNVHGIKGEIIHGDIKQITKRINELLYKNNKTLLYGKTYGVIGTPSDWLIASIPDSDEVYDKFGCHIEYIDLRVLLNEYAKINIDNSNLSGFDENELKKAVKVNQALENICLKYKLDGFTLRCFDLLDTIKTTGCLGLARLNEKGFIGTCEGDIMAMLSMAIAKAISGKSCFQANPSRIDIQTNRVVFAHCTIPLDMVNSYKFMTHFESGIGVAVKGELNEDTVTIFRLSSDLKTYFVSRGKIISNLNYDNLCRTQIEVELEENVNQLLTNPCGNHHIIFYGDYVDEIKELLR